MLIILEGCDGVGKTTLAELLKSTINGSTIIHCNRETPNDMKFFKDIICAADGGTIIADRFCYGQFVYQNDDERPLNYDPDECEWYTGYKRLHELETHMLNYVDVKLIYVYSDADEIYKRATARGEIIDADRILKKYKELWTKTLIQPIYFKT